MVCRESELYPVGFIFVSYSDALLSSSPGGGEGVVDMHELSSLEVMVLEVPMTLSPGDLVPKLLFQRLQEPQLT